MEFQRVLALRGPNLWARFPVLEAWVDLQDLRDTASSEIPGFNARLQSMLPGLVEHRCSEGVRGGFYQRLERGTYLAHILEHVVLELQSLAGTEVIFGKSRLTNTDGVYRVVVRYQNEALGRAALETGRRLCLAAVHELPFDVASELAQLQDLHQKTRLSDLNLAVLAAAKERNVPTFLLDRGGLLQLGQGARQHRFLNSLTDRTSAIGTSIAYDWELTRGLLEAVGVPCPYGKNVGSRDDAWSLAEYVGLPVILKPRYQSGLGKPLGPFETRDEIQAAYDQAMAEGWSPLVEHAVEGDGFELLMIGDKLVDARHGDQSVTPQVHLQTTAIVADAVRVVGLDMAEVTVVARDISLPLAGQNGVVVNLRSQPPLEKYLSPSLGNDLIEHLFPSGQSGRIPLVSVTGTNGKTTTTRLTAHLLGQAYAPVGMCCTEGIYVGSRRTQTGDCSGPKSARAVLQHPDVQAAVLEVARGGILREGLGFDRCDVAIVTNIGEGDHLGMNEVDTPEQLAYVKSTIVWSVLPTGFAVLNAADPLVVNMAQYCPGKIIYFALAEDQPVLAAHRQQSGRVVFTRDNTVIFAEGDRETPLLSLSQVPLTRGGRVSFQVDNVLAAAAACWALDVSHEKICSGLKSFGAGMDSVPARFNLLDINGLTVILDYGHNTSSLARLLEVLKLFPHKNRTAMYSAAGDRRDEDIVRQGEMLGNAFDRVIIYEDTYLRGRQQGDITRLFRRGMNTTNRITEILEVQGGLRGLAMALEVSNVGDLLLIQPDLIDDGVAFLKQTLASGGREITMDEALRCSGSQAADHPPCSLRVSDSAESDTQIRVSNNHLGNAVYARRSFLAGQRVFTGTGDIIMERTRYTIQVDDDLHLDPHAPLGYLNHSCSPNCGLVIRRGSEALVVHALTDIKAGEELTLDYATFEREIAVFTGPCLCGSSACRGRLTGYGGLSPERRQYYGHYIAEYLRDTDTPILVEALSASSQGGMVVG